MSRFWSSRTSKMAAPNLSSQEILAETFEKHWQQLKEIIHCHNVPTNDDVVAIINLLNQLTAILTLELSTLDDNAGALRLDSLGSEPSSMSLHPCLDILLSENILSHVLAASRMPINVEQQDTLRLEQLRLYEVLLAQGLSSLLSHQPFLRPLIELLNEVANQPDEAVISEESKSRLVMLLSQLCSRLQDNLDLLEVFFTHGKFAIFDILCRFLHHEGHVGGQARDALLLCMALSERHDGIGEFIAKSTDFCHHLATGLSGLYSRLPRRLDTHHQMFTHPTWYRLSNVDLTVLPPDVQLFLSTLDFCDAVIQVAHPAIKNNLIGLIYMGFLVPVLGPALTQTLESELVCSTAYVELFLRRINEPKLLAVFLRFIFVDNHDNAGQPIIDIMVHRLSYQGQLSMVTLSFFETLIGLNCEDVMLWLVFRHLIPQSVFLPSQRALIRNPDIHGRTAEKLLQMTPICCQEARKSHCPSTTPQLPTFLVGLGRPSTEDGLIIDSASEAFPDDFQPYLVDARKAVRDRFEATRCWLYDYDGLNPSGASISNNNTECDKYDNGPLSLTEEEDQEFWSLMSLDKPDRNRKDIAKKDSLSSWSTSSSQVDLIDAIKDSDVDHSISSLGPFLDALFEKVELMPVNSLPMNLLVTSVISQLASYPQPLLRAVLLHPDIVLQPSVRGLYNAIASLRQKLDNIMPTLAGSDEAMLATRKFLNDRMKMSKRRGSNASMISTITNLGNEAGRSAKNSFTAAFSSMFKSSITKKSSSSSSPTNSSELDSNSEVGKYAMAAIILEEWLQELAAIAQEQSVLMKETAFNLGMALDKADHTTTSAIIIQPRD